MVEGLRIPSKPASDVFLVRVTFSTLNREHTDLKNAYYFNKILENTTLLKF